MKTVVATALLLALLLFLLPLLVVNGTPLALGTAAAVTLPPAPAAASPTPSPSAGQRADETRTVRVKMKDGTVQTLTMADYLWGVVAAEMPAAFEPEALKAQAVAARTYACSKLGRTSQNHPDADLCADSACCQAYLTQAQAAANWGEAAGVYTQKIADAVAATDGIAILYDGQPIQAVFHSSSAGRTLDAVEVWGRSVPYLTGVSSPEGDEVPNYHTTVTVAADDFKAKFLAACPEADLSGEPSRWFGSVTHASNGGVEAMEVGGVSVSGAKLRGLFSLRSASFSVSGDASAVTFLVTGYGHGVGMSQYGANALAKEGKLYPEILEWYYTGVTVARYL